MQVNNSPRFIKNAMLGLIASGFGTLVALPSVAMPETTADVPAADIVSEEPAAAETLPAPGAAALEAAPVAEEELLEAAPIAEEDMMMEEEPIAEEDMTMEEEPIADEDMMMEEEEPIADEDVLEEAPVVEESVEGDDTEVAEEEIDTREFTIAELTGNSDVFKTLAAALDAAELTEILGGEGPFTVFAPTDDAFAELPEGALDQLLLPENKEVLIQILTYHVVPGAILSGDLESGSVATVEGSDLTVEVDDTVTVNNANVLVADVEASNGVIHIIDRVILPPAPAAAADADSTEVDQ